jgi:hypothetical protein
MFFYYLFKTECKVDKSAFFGIHRSQNPSWGSDGQPVDYYGTGVKLKNKVIQCIRTGRFGATPSDVLQIAFTHEVLYVSGDYNDVKKKLDAILTPVTLADPKCLNMPLPATKTPEHKSNISEAMVGNQNALGLVQPDAARAAIASSKKKMKWWSNPVTREEVQLEADEEGLTGFELGRLKKA